MVKSWIAFGPSLFHLIGRCDCWRTSAFEESLRDIRVQVAGNEVIADGPDRGRWVVYCTTATIPERPVGPRFRSSRHSQLSQRLSSYATWHVQACEVSLGQSDEFAQDYLAVPHAQIHHLSRPPITEAVIDIRARLTDGANVETLAKLPSPISDEYPTKETLHAFQGELQIAPGAVAQATGRDMGVQGYRFISPVRDAVVQFRLDGFTFSRLRPYTDWLQILAEAKRLWSYYVTVAPIEAILRLAVRYINNFSVPPGAQPEDYLTQPPILPAGISRGVVRAALSRALASDMETRSNCLVTQALERTAENGISVVLDIDAHKPVQLGPGVDFWPEFEQLHDVKNRIFFGSITDAAVREFE